MIGVKRNVEIAVKYQFIAILIEASPENNYNADWVNENARASSNPINKLAP